MKIVCAPDSFKGSMTAPQAAAAMAAGVRRVAPDSEIIELPIADGGEGFTDAIAAATGAELIEVAVHDQRGELHSAAFALTRDESGTQAVLDVAASSGLERVPPEERRVFEYDSRGLGEMIRAALDTGATRLVIGIGGSSTSEGGAGMLAELGVALLDAADSPIEPNPAGLRSLARVDASGIDPRLASVQVEVACDVTNPLLGPNGAAAVYGPQKGATPEMVAELDVLVGNLVACSGPDAQRVADLPGSGAAGGLGWALQYFLKASLRPGLELVAEVVGLDAQLADADLILTAEGSVDQQTPHGKAIQRVCQHAAEAGVPVLVFGGRVSVAKELLAGDVVDLITITPADQPLPEALLRGAENLERATAEAVGNFLATR